MNILITNKIYIDGVKPSLKRWVRQNYVIPNPEYITRVKLNKWLGGTPKTLKLYEEVGDSLVLPYGCLQALYMFLLHTDNLAEIGIDTKLNTNKTADWEGNDIIPRDYQRVAVNQMIYHKYGILKAPCSSGKTVMGHLIAKQTGMRTLWLTHTKELLNQSKAVGEILLGKDNGRIGTITDGKVNPGSVITYATVQTMAKLDPSCYKHEYNCVIVDECFPGNTIIETAKGQKPLKSLRIGDIIASYNVETKEVEYKPVLHVFKLKAHDIVKVTFSNGKQVVCTSNHPFYTQNGEWKRADELGGNDYVMSLLPQRVFGTGHSQEQSLPLSKNRKMVLLKRMWRKLSVTSCKIRRFPCKISGKHEEGEQSVSRTDSGSHEKQQPYERSGCKKTGFPKAKRDWASSKDQVRKWLRSYCSSTNLNACVSGNLGSVCGISYTNKNVERFRLSDLLQGRHSNPIGNGSCRSGRKHSLFARSSRSRSEKGRVFEWIRVESVEIQEQTSDGTFAGMCEDGYVYNIEVADNNNYFADGILVHNCHRCVGSVNSYKMFSFVINHIAAEYKYGLSATPETKNGYGKTVTCNLGDIKYEIKQDVLEEQGTIMPVKIHPVVTGWAYPKKAFKSNGVVDFDKAVRYLHRDTDRNRLIVDLIEDKPTLILSDNIEHLCRIANELSEDQKKYACLVSTKHDEDVLDAEILCKHTPKAIAEYIDKMRSGELNIMLATYQLAKEGLNIPRLEQVILAFPAVDSNIITQSVGRVARCCEGKEEAVCYDIVDTPSWFQKHWRERKRLYKQNGNEII